MKVALIGASGFVGTAVLNELVQRGHQVTAIARNTGKIKKQAGVTVVEADALNAKQLAAAVEGNDAAVSTYNAGWTNPDLYNAFLAGSRSVQEAVKASGVKRFIVVGGAGSLYIAPDVQLVDTAQFPAEWKPGALAARDYLNYIKEEKELDWTFLSPAIEMHQGTAGVRRGTYRVGKDEPVFDENGKSVASVEDIAVAIVDELEHPKHIKERFTIAY